MKLNDLPGLASPGYLMYAARAETESVQVVAARAQPRASIRNFKSFAPGSE